MKICLCFFALIFFPTFLLSESVQLQNRYLTVTINLGDDGWPGSISQIISNELVGYPVFNKSDQILSISAGMLHLERFSVVTKNDTSLKIESTELYSSNQHFPFLTDIEFKIDNNKIIVNYQFKAINRIEFTHGLDILVRSSKWKTVKVFNHIGEQDSIEIGQKNEIHRFALKPRYVFSNSVSTCNILIANPYKSFVTLEAFLSDIINFRWHILYSSAPIKAKNPRGPRLASVLEAGDIVQRQIILAITDSSSESMGSSSPTAYFAPFPNGYEQIIAMTFDDIPFVRWKFPKSGHDPDAPLQQYLIRLLEEHPRMKMGWIILPDAITSIASLQNPDYPPGQWWKAHGVHRILTAAPEEYKQWLKNIDQNRNILGYEDRIHLGSHGYHHTPEMQLSLTEYEFEYYDPVGHGSTIFTINRELEQLGLSEETHKWIRFPGFYFTRSTVDALLKYGYIFFDYGGYNHPPWMFFQANGKRIWAVGTFWEGDTPSPYKMMKEILAQGRFCYTAGHPFGWFKNGDENAFNQINQIFTAAESDFPHLGYMFPDDIGYYAEKTYKLNNIAFWKQGGKFYFSFKGATSQDQTLVLDFATAMDIPDKILFDGKPIDNFNIRGKKLIVLLPKSENTTHVIETAIKIDFVKNQPSKPEEWILLENFPNPFGKRTSIICKIDSKLIGSAFEISIYNILGQKVTTIITGKAFLKRYRMNWDGRDVNGRKLPYGVYLLRLRVGKYYKTIRMLHLK